ncbi:MAG: hypothetical protein KDA42_16955 [Planctomycetales bacterium]|nr:hypothetical protein [Planctomycetales bacterium]
MEDELIPCPGCDEELSPYVNKCPKCGMHMHRRGRTKITTGNTIGVAVRIFIGGVVVLLLCGVVAYWATL